MSKRYYDSKIREFHEHKLGKLTMDEDVKRFIELISTKFDPVTNM
jgi:hypothetical protein